MYSPEIKSNRVRELYALKLKTGKTMTKLVDEAIAEYLAKENNKELCVREATATQECHSDSLCGKGKILG